MDMPLWEEIKAECSAGGQAVWLHGMNVLKELNHRV